MSLFKTKSNKKAAAASADGKSFLSDTRNELAGLYHQYVEAGDQQYEELGALLSDLEADAWNVVERALKQSFRNGVAKGRSRRSAS